MCRQPVPFVPYAFGQLIHLLRVIDGLNILKAKVIVPFRVTNVPPHTLKQLLLLVLTSNMNVR